MMTNRALDLLMISSALTAPLFAQQTRVHMPILRQAPAPTPNSTPTPTPTPAPSARLTPARAPAMVPLRVRLAPRTSGQVISQPSASSMTAPSQGTTSAAKPGSLGQASPAKPVVTGTASAPTAEPLSALASISGQSEIDRPSHLLWSVARSGGMGVKAGETFGLSYLSRGKPSYKRVALLFGENVGSVQGGVLCGSLTGGGDRLTVVEGQITSEPANDELAAAAKAQGVQVPGSGPLFLVNVTAAFNGDLVTAAAMNKKVAVRALPLGADRQCLRSSGAAYVATLSPWKEGGITVVVPDTPKQPPAVAVMAAPVGWAPSIDGMNCSYIITAKVADAAWDEVLKAKGISRATGTHFTLCQSEFTTTYNNLSDYTKAKIAIQDALGAFSGAFNWTAGKFQSIASTLATPLKPIVGNSAATMFTQGLMGQLPGSPLTGDINMVVDQGCSYVKQKIGAAAAEQSNQQELSAGDKKKSDDAVQQACDAVRAAMQEGAKANSFLAHDLGREPRNPIMYVRVTYMAMNGAPAGMMSKEQNATLSVRSNGGPGPYAQGNGNFFGQVLLVQRDVRLPAGAAGTSVVLPFLVSYVKRNSQEFTVGATAYAGMRATAGGYAGNDLKMNGLFQPIAAPTS